MTPTDRIGGRSRDELSRDVQAYLVQQGLAEDEARRDADDLLRREGERGHGLLSAAAWSLVLRGVLAIAAGVLFLARPVQALATLVLIFGAWIFVDGVIALVTSVARRRSWHMVMMGLIGIVVGYLILTRPGGAAVVFYTLAAIWAMAHGVSEISVGVSMHRDEPGKTALIAVGIVSFLFGILLLVAPYAGITALGWWIGLYALLYGAMMLFLAYDVRRTTRHLLEPFEPPRGAPQPHPV